MRLVARNASTGFTLTEALVGILIVSVVGLAMVGVFRTNNQASLQQNTVLDVQENLRVAMDRVTGVLRTAGHGVPDRDLELWVDWVTDADVDLTDDEPVEVVDGGTAPDSLVVIACTGRPVARLAEDVAAGTTTFDVASLVPDGSGGSEPVNDLLDASAKRLIRMEREHARVTAQSGTTVTIDTDPYTSGNEAFHRGFLANTPLCRIDAFRFDVNTTGTVPVLEFTDYDASSGAPLVEGISDLQVTAVGGGVYDVTLTAQSSKDYPGTNASATKSLTSRVTLRN